MIVDNIIEITKGAALTSTKQPFLFCFTREHAIPQFLWHSQGDHCFVVYSQTIGLDTWSYSSCVCVPLFQKPSLPEQPNQWLSPLCSVTVPLFRELT